MNGVDLSGLQKSFGEQRVLDGVELDVPAGSVTAVLGPSGSGKTTLLRIIAGFERADQGTVRIGERVVDGPGVFVAAEQRQIGYVPQEGSLFPHLTVTANVGFGLPRRHRKGPKVEALLEMVGLAGLGRRYPYQLSGGQQQRVALARALAVRPQVVLLDEPFSSLDATLRAAVRHDVVSVLRAAGTTAVMVTHDQDEALSVADLVAVIRDGRIGQVDNPRDLYRRPTDPDLAGFVGEANLVAGSFHQDWVVTPLGRHRLAGPHPILRQGAPALVLLRPEQIEVRRDPGSGSCAGRVIDVEFYGHDTVVRVVPEADCGVPLLVARSAGGERWDAGSRVGLAAHGPVRAWPAPAGPPAAGQPVKTTAT